MNRAAILALLALPFLSAQSLVAETKAPKTADAPSVASAQSAAIQRQMLTAPLQFEENRGQAPAQYDYVSRGRECSVLLRADEARVVLPVKSGMAQASLKLAAASADIKGVALAPLPGKINYFKGQDSGKWVKEVATNGRIKYAGIYPGIDLVYYGSQQKLEYDFVVAPHVDPNLISWNADGMDSVKVNSEGALVLTIAGRDLLMQKPVAYQVEAGVKTFIDAQYKVAGNHICFALKAYDTSKELVIDPVVQFVYSSYLGGTVADSISAITVDKNGSVYMAGWTMSPDFTIAIPTQTGTVPQSAHAVDFNKDAFVVKLNQLTLSGSTIISGTSTALYGSAVNVSGSNFTVTGSNLTVSGTAAVSGVVLSGSNNLISGANVIITGSNLLVSRGAQYVYAFSTFLGGNAADEATGIALDGTGAIYVAGNTVSTALNFPLVNAYQSQNGGGMDGFVAKLKSDGSSILYSTFIGTSGDEAVKGIAATSSGKASIVGNTTSKEFYGHTSVTASGTSNQGTFTLTVTKIIYKADGSTEEKSETTAPITELEPYDGSIGSEASLIEGSLNNLNLAKEQGVYTVTARAKDPNTNQPQRTYDIQLTLSSSTKTVYKLSAAGSEGSFPGVGVIASVFSIVTPGTTATNVFYSLSLGLGSGISDGFALKLDENGSIITASSQIIGGSGEDSVNSVAMDVSGFTYIAGDTQCKFIAPPNRFEIVPFVAKLTGSTLTAKILADLTKSSPFSDAGWGSGVTVDLLGNSYLTGATVSRYFPVFNAFQTYPDTLDVAAANDPAGSGYNGFLTKLDNGLNIIYSTYLGGSKYDCPYGLAVAESNNAHYAYVVGETQSADFPVLGGATLQSSDHHSGNAFLTVFSDAGNALRYSTYFGGSGLEEGLAVAISPVRLRPAGQGIPSMASIAFVGGYTKSDDFLTTAHSLQDVSPYSDLYTSGFVSAFQDRSVDMKLVSIVSDTEVPIPGQAMTYTVTVKNLSETTDAELVRVWQTLSDSLQFVSADGSNVQPFSGNAQDTTTKTVVATLGPVLARREVSYRITVKPTGPQVLSTTATVEAEFDETINNNSYTLQQVARPVVSLATTQAQASEDGTPGIFTISRVGDLSTVLKVVYTIGGTATNGFDYQKLTGSVLLPAGAASVDVAVNPIADTETDDGETVEITVIKGPDYETDKLGTSLSGTVTIADVAANKVNVSAPDPTASKSGDSATFTISRTGLLSSIQGQPLTVTYNLFGSASNGLDYKIVGQDGKLVSGTSGTVTIPAGASSANVVIVPIPDVVSGQPVLTSTVGLALVSVPPTATTPGSSYILGAATSAQATITDFEPDVVGVTATVPNAYASGTSGFFRITRTGDEANDAANPLTVQYEMTGAAPGQDYELLSGLATIPAGGTYVDVEVKPVVTTGTTDKSAILTILPPANTSAYALASGSTATVTILHFDGAVVTVTTTRPLASLTGTTGAFQVKRTGGDLTSPLSVSYQLDGSAVTGLDYTLLSGSVALSGSVTIPANQAFTTVNVQAKANPAASGTGSAILTVLPSAGSLVGTPSSATVNVVSTGSATKPIITLAATQSAASESGTNGIFTLTRTGDVSQALGVDYTVAGSAKNGIDYQELNGTAAFLAGSSTATVIVQPVLDNETEVTETVLVQLTSNPAYDLGSASAATVTIANAAATGRQVVSLVVTDSSASEDGDQAIFTVVRTGTAGVISIPYTIGGTATNGVDYEALSGNLVIPGGLSSGTITINPASDGISEPTESVIIQLQAGVGYALSSATTGIASIANVDTLRDPIVYVLATSGTGSESGDPAVFTVYRAGDTTGAISVPYTMSGSATPGLDYKALTGVLVIPAGASSGEIVIDPIADNVGELMESVIVTLGSGVGYTLGVNTSATAVIENVSDNTVSVSATDPAASEAGHAGTFTISRIGNLENALTVYYKLGGTATNGVDYLRLSGSAVIPANATSVDLSLVPLRDLLNDPDETVVLTLSTDLGYTLGAPSSAMVTIADVPAPTVTIVASGTATEAGVSGTFKITRTGSTLDALTVKYTAAGSGLSGTDYKALAGSVTIPAGSVSANVILTPLVNAASNSDKTVILTLPTSTIYIVGTAKSATLTIKNYAGPIVTAAVVTGTTKEGSATPASVRFTRTGATTSALSVRYAVGGTATKGEYTVKSGTALLSGTAVIPATATSVTVAIYANADTLAEGNETVKLMAVSGTNYIVGAANAATVTIMDTAPGVVSIMADPAATSSYEKGGQLRVIFSRNGTTGDLKVNYTLGGTAKNGTDYSTVPATTGTTGSITIKAGYSSATLVMPTIDNSTIEPNRTIIVTGAIGTSYTIGSSAASALLTILDDDLHSPTL